MKLLFERSRPGRGNDLLPPCDVPVTQFDPSLLRGAPLRLPEIAEVTWAGTIRNWPSRPTGSTMDSILWAPAP